MQLIIRDLIYRSPLKIELPNFPMKMVFSMGRRVIYGMHPMNVHAEKLENL